MFLENLEETRVRLLESFTQQKHLQSLDGKSPFGLHLVSLLFRKNANTSHFLIGLSWQTCLE